MPRLETHLNLKTTFQKIEEQKEICLTSISCDQGPTDYIKLSIIGGKKVQFQYQAGSGPLGVNVETSYHLNDNTWHSISVERNR